MADDLADTRSTLWTSGRLPVADVVERLRAALSSRYIIEGELGRGGMAVVLLARDLKHGRKVAIKVLHPELADAVGSARFLREVRTTAGLHHPHVLPLYDSGEATGLLYYIMPYVQGETLAERIRREGALPMPAALEFAVEIADALVYAHSRGIVHRDVKPSNVLLSEGVHACVADFGLARLVSSAVSHDLTSTGMAVGSPHYMSPEQISGAPEASGRSDVYALGCLLFEMLAGHPPFEGATVQAVWKKHLIEEPPSLRAERPDVEPALEQLVHGAMRKDPSERPDAETIRDRLRALAATVGGTAPLPRGSAGRVATAVPPAIAARRPRPRWVTSLLALAGLLAVGAVGTVLYRELVSESSAAVESDDALAKDVSLAVMPFHDSSGQPDTSGISDGIREDIITKLGKLGEFTVLSSAATTSYRESGKTVLEIGRELGATTLLTGSYGRSGDRVTIRVELVDASDGRLLWSDRFDREITDIFEMQNQIVGEIITRLQRELTPAQEVRLREIETQSISAYGYYQKAREYLLQFREPRDVEIAIGHYTKALEVDPRYALAAAGKGLAYQILVEYYRDTQSTTALQDSAIAYARHAIRLDDGLADGYAVLGRALNDERPLDAAVQLNHAIRLNPNHVTAISEMSRVLSALGRYDESLARAQQAATLEPTRAIRHSDVAEVYIYLEDFTEAERRLNHALELEPDDLWANYLLAWIYTARGQPDAADEYIQTILDAGPGGSWGYVQAGWFRLYRGDYQGALAEYEKAADLTPSNIRPPLEVAYIHRVLGRAETAEEIFASHESAARAALARGAQGPKPYVTLARVAAARGDHARAVQLLETARDRGWRDVYRLTMDPLLVGLLGEPRFQRLTGSMRADLEVMRQKSRALEN